MSNRLAGLSYGGDCLAWGRRFVPYRAPQPVSELLELVLDSVHIGNLGPLPPSPNWLAYKGEQIGLGKRSEFFK